jgi:hypothetical protein
MKTPKVTRTKISECALSLFGKERSIATARLDIAAVPFELLRFFDFARRRAPGQRD